MMLNRLTCVVLASLLLVGCSSDTGDGTGAPDGGVPVDAGPVAQRPQSDDKIAISGVWESAFGGNEVISDKAWVSFGSAVVIKFDNDKRTAVTQNAADDKYNPSKFNKIVWTTPKETTGEWKTRVLYYCIVDFSLESLKMADETTKTADDTDPAKSGCGDFGWTKLSSVETVGTWTTNFASEELVTELAWSHAWLREFDNVKNVAYTQNPADAKYEPSTFSKLVWTEAKAGKWWYCTVDFGLKTLEDAKKSGNVADDDDPGKSGCGTFSWTEMSAK